MSNSRSDRSVSSTVGGRAAAAVFAFADLTGLPLVRSQQRGCLTVLNGGDLYNRRRDVSLIRFGRYDFVDANSLPTDLVQKLRESAKTIANTGDRAIGAFFAAGWIFIVTGANSYQEVGVPQKLLDAIETARQQNHALNHLAAGANDAWVLIYDNNDFKASDNLPPGMLTALESLKRNQKSVRAIALSPVSPSRVIVAEK